MLRFVKYEASGNDFVIVDEIDGPAPAVDAEAMCDRWTGVGADGLIRVTRGTAAPFRFDLTNADGSPAEMSGNGMRCVGAYLREMGRGRGRPGAGGAPPRARSPGPPGQPGPAT
jgi:diaminopimelate epimerase